MRYQLIATKDAKNATPDAPPDPSVPDSSTQTGPNSDAGASWSGEPFGDKAKISDPEKAFASFSDDAGDKAWLDRASDGTLTGWVTDATDQTYRYSDTDAWAVDVDDAGMKRTGGSGPEGDGKDETDGGAADTTEPDEATTTDAAGADADQMSMLKEGKSLVLQVKHMGDHHDQSAHGTRSAGRHGMNKRSQDGKLPRRSHQIVATDATGNSMDKVFGATPGFKAAAPPAGMTPAHDYANTPGSVFADEGWQADGKKRYPVDDKDEVDAGLSYIARKRNADRYTPENLAKVKANLRAAAHKHGIDTAA